MGAVPIATAVAVASHARGKKIPAFFVRKAAQDHGTPSLVEGLAPGESMKGKHVVVVEDVTTTGGSAMKAVVELRKEGAVIARVVTVVDRDEGATEFFAKEKIPFTAILGMDAFR